jgi:hypothetical protein
MINVIDNYRSIIVGRIFTARWTQHLLASASKPLTNASLSVGARGRGVVGVVARYHGLGIRAAVVVVGNHDP